MLAALCQTAWTFCLKFMRVKDLRISNFYSWHSGLLVLLPFAGVIIFGLINTLLFSMAIKRIPTAVAYATWMAATLTFVKIVELTYFHHGVSIPEIFFMLMIMAGIFGLKIYAVQPK